MANAIVATGNSSPANCREKKSTSSTLIGTISNGTTVNAVRCDSTWATLQLNGTPCFMLHRMLTGISATNGDGLSTTNNKAKLNTNSVNVRTGPGESYGKTGTQLSRGTAVTIYDKMYNLSEQIYWYRINTTTASPARWVRGDFLAPNSSGSGGTSGMPWPVSTDTSDGYPNSKVIEIAWKYSQPSHDADHVTNYSIGTLLNVQGSSSDDFFQVASGIYVLRSCVDNSYCNKAPEVFFGNQTMSSGSYGWNVYALQHFLNRYLGYRNYTKITVDGSYGSTTKTKVESFQQYMNSQYAANLSVDGIAGPATQMWLVTFVQNKCD